MKFFIGDPVVLVKPDGFRYTVTEIHPSGRLTIECPEEQLADVVDPEDIYKLDA